jgi:hypothetical protein
MGKNKNNSEQNRELKILVLLAKATIGITFLLMTVAVYVFYLHGSEKNIDTIAAVESKKTFDVQGRSALNESEVSASIVDGKDEQSGLLAGEGLQIVKVNCTGCHSGTLITQNRMSRERWKETIHWMQETQGLWDLGENEAVILDYLAENYSPLPTGGRRRPLENIQWYSLED